MFDVIIIGGGVVGGLLLRELSKYEMKVCLVEKEQDVCMGASKANSGIVHAGFDAKPSSLKAKFNVQGNEMFPTLCEELGVKYRKNGSLVVSFSQEETATLYALKERGEKNGVKGLEILSQERLRSMEKNIAQTAQAALYAPTGGIVCPYELTIASIGNAMDNGAELFTDFEVVSIQKQGEIFLVCSSAGQQISGKIVVNCAGLASGKIASLVGDTYITVNGRKGEYILLDRESGDLVGHTLFFTPTALGKGILVTQTVDNNILLGPTAELVNDGNTETSGQGLSALIEKARQMCPNLPLYNTITSFSGVRAYSNQKDFIIEESRSEKGIIHCAGIESPGLTSAPAIAKYVTETLIGNKIPLKKRPSFNPKRVASHAFKDLSIEEKNEWIAKDASYGKIVCRCEQITEGEILCAIRQNPPAKDIDGVKRRTRSGMGRCQGGFCQPYIAELLAKERAIALEKVTKKGGQSNLLIGRTK